MKNMMDTVVGEMCCCGHDKSDHDGLIHAGHCKSDNCDCGQFTWASFIFAEEERNDAN